MITDIDMPGMSGFDVVENIRSNIMSVPIVLMSSDYLPVDPDNVEKLGVSAIISKAIDNDTFCNVVRTCLQKDKIYTSKIF